MEKSNSSIAKFQLTVIKQVGYAQSMYSDWRKRLHDRMIKLGFDMKSLSKAAGLGDTAVYDMLKRSTSPRVEQLKAVGKQLGMSLAELVDGEVRPPLRAPIIGEIGETDTWRAYQTDKKVPDILDLPSDREDLISVRVVGNSMAPRYQKGDILLGSRIFGNNADNYIGLPCILKTNNEQTYVKVLTRGEKPNTYTLRSLDPSEEDVANVSLLWFAPIVAIMPRAG